MEELQATSNTDFFVNGVTIGVNNVLGLRYIVQVYERGVRLLEGGSSPL